MKHNTPRILALNPWIHDFAAHGFWSLPLGLLQLAAILLRHGFTVDALDLTGLPPNNRHGRGPYIKTPAPRPQGLSDVPRAFSRYGIPPGEAKARLAALSEPDAILVTSHMTYWHTGVAESIRLVRSRFPKTPVVLGGVYATLCPEHARRSSGADLVVTGPAEEILLPLAGRLTGFNPAPLFDTADLRVLPWPALDLAGKPGFAPLLTGRGCPNHCAYCAQRLLQPRASRRDPLDVAAEIRHWHTTLGVTDFAFYDDALLHKPREHAIPLLTEIIRMDLPLRFHTPNAVHLAPIDQNLAVLLWRAGFRTLRLGVETTDIRDRENLDGKVKEGEFEAAAAALRTAGFGPETAGAYLLAGLPGQDWNALAHSIRTVKTAGLRPIPAWYTPVPGTRMWEQAARSSRYDLAADPLFTNNAILPCQREPFSWSRISWVKSLCAP